MKFEVEYIHVIERRITCTVEAVDKKEAVVKARQGDVINSDEDGDCPEDGIETRDFKVKEVK